MNFLEGLILKGVGGFYEVYTAGGTFTCKGRGVLRKKGISPIPGDYVKIKITDEYKREGTIEEVLPRRNSFIRPLVSNMDQLLIVMAVKSPEPDFLLVDKLIITAEFNKVKPLLCINKIDLATHEEIEKICSQFKQTGYDIMAVCAKTEDGLDVLREKLTAKSTALAGQSGVGKSTILNRILKEWVMETGEVSKKVQRGKHTTRHAQLLPLECGGFVVDTPGFSSFELETIQYDELDRLYPEFIPYLGKCKFSGCSHINEPDCAVKEAVHLKDIDTERYERYATYWQELKAKYEKKYRR